MPNDLRLARLTFCVAILVTTAVQGKDFELLKSEESTRAYSFAIIDSGNSIAVGIRQQLGAPSLNVVGPYHTSLQTP